jgi:predicted AAA+ superfamily ATPase
MRIERDIISQFKAWKDTTDRKPILLKGARQIGKTWAMKTFGQECFEITRNTPQNIVCVYPC